MEIWPLSLGLTPNFILSLLHGCGITVFSKLTFHLIIKAMSRKFILCFTYLILDDWCVIVDEDFLNSHCWDLKRQIIYKYNNDSFIQYQHVDTFHVIKQHSLQPAKFVSMHLLLQHQRQPYQTPFEACPYEWYQCEISNENETNSVKWKMQFYSIREMRLLKKPTFFQISQQSRTLRAEKGCKSTSMRDKLIT